MAAQKVRLAQDTADNWFCVKVEVSIARASVRARLAPFSEYASVADSTVHAVSEAQETDWNPINELLLGM
jgi:hypothetical protein